MKAIILAAGYATRLYPLTKDKPKPLLEVGGKPIVEIIINKMSEIKEIDEIFVITNNKFFSQFEDWLKKFNTVKKIKIVNDKTLSNEDRLGSLGDINYVIENENVKEDIMVIAGDNLFEFSLKEFYEFYKKHNTSCVALYDVNNFELAKQYGIVGVDNKNKIINFVEKPANPQSTLASTGVYIYPKEILPTLQDFVKIQNPDKAGNFLEVLHKEKQVYGFVTKEKWYDIGTLPQLEAARKEYAINKNPIINYEDFAKLDLRVAQIIKVEDIEGADKLYKLTINLGTEQRTICAGIKPYYAAEQLQDKKIIMLTNLAPRKLKGIESQGMLLAVGDDEGKVKLLTIDGDMEVGSGVS